MFFLFDCYAGYSVNANSLIDEISNPRSIFSKKEPGTEAEADCSVLCPVLAGRSRQRGWKKKIYRIEMHRSKII